MALLDHPLSGTLSRLNDKPVARHALPALYRHGVKRPLDLTLVLATLPFWLPIILVTALLVARDGHNPFYTQARIGRHGRVFRMLKLRSMTPDADAVLEKYLRENAAARAEWTATQKLKHDPRVTRVGAFIRKTSIDEFPQLVNVLLGDMSVVGPRPMMVCQKSLYPGSLYYEMRPGLTGFWQISNRNHCRFVGRARYDNAYYRAMSLRTDLVVILRTVGVVLRGTGY
jgi:lipopolysaccharide/colanic/teichoic acid biosynthesis glycosyltransferase